jgi:nucleotide-binding universal stress UspA family protein
MTNSKQAPRAEEGGARVPRAADTRHALPGALPEELIRTRAYQLYEEREGRGIAAPILAAIKPHDPNDAVLELARWLAEHEHRELNIVSVLETAPLISSFAAGAPTLPPFHDEEERRAVKRDIRRAYERTGRAGSHIRVDVLEGSAAATIADIAREQEACMVVVGKGTHRLLSHLLYGEQVMEIIRGSQAPVLVVPPNLALPIERAMVAFDFSLASIRAALRAHAMLARGGRLTLVHVASPRRVTGKRSQWWLRSIERRTRETLGEFARALPPRAGVTVAMEKLHGDPVEVLTAYAESHEMQLLACGWHEHALLQRLFVASSAVELLHRARCAVLVAPAIRNAHQPDNEAG